MATYYIDPINGSDTNAGTLLAPWKTIFRSWARSNPTSTDILYLRAGTHHYLDSDGLAIRYNAADDAHRWLYGGTYTPYVGSDGVAEEAWFQCSFQVTNQSRWTAVSSDIWSVNLSDEEWPTNKAGLRMIPRTVFANRPEPLHISNRATCVAGSVVPSPSCVGYYRVPTTYVGTHNGRPFYSAGSYLLFWDGSYWRICTTRTATDAAYANYWYLNVENATTPQSDAEYTPAGTCTGNPKITYAEVPSVGNAVLPADFTSPPVQTADHWGVIAFYDEDGELVYDLQYYDSINEVLYLRTRGVGVQIVAPWSEAYMMMHDPYFRGTGLVFDTVKFRPGSLYSSKSGASAVTFRNCEPCWQMVGANSNGIAVVGCDFPYATDGGYFSPTTGIYSLNNQDHSIYTYGTTGDAYLGNFFLPSPGGAPLHFYHLTLACNDYSVADNVVYTWQGALVLWRGTGNPIRNNVFVCEPRWMTTSFEQLAYYSNAVFSIGNYGVTTSPIQYNYIESWYRVFLVTGAATVQAIDYNIVVMPYDNGQVILNLTDATISSMNHNLFVLNGDHGATINGVAYTQAQFVAWLESNNWRDNIFLTMEEAGAAPLGARAAQSFLDSSPTFADKMEFFRAWALRFTDYPDRGPILNLAYEGKTLELDRDATIQLVDSTGTVSIGGEEVAISTDGTVLVWDGINLGEGDSWRFTAGGVEYQITADSVATDDCTITLEIVTYNGYTHGEVLRSVATNASKIGTADADSTEAKAAQATIAGFVTSGVKCSDKTNFLLASAYDPAKTASQAGDAMTLTSGERALISSGTATAVSNISIDGVSFSKLLALMLSTAAGKVSTTDNGDGTYTATFLAQDGAATVFSVTYNPLTGTRATTAVIA